MAIRQISEADKTVWERVDSLISEHRDVPFGLLIWQSNNVNEIQIKLPWIYKPEGQVAKALTLELELIKELGSDYDDVKTMLTAKGRQWTGYEDYNNTLLEQNLADAARNKRDIKWYWHSVVAALLGAAIGSSLVEIVRCILSLHKK